MRKNEANVYICPESLKKLTRKVSEESGDEVITGKLISELISGKKISTDLTPFKVDRF